MTCTVTAPEGWNRCALQRPGKPALEILSCNGTNDGDQGKAVVGKKVINMPFRAAVMVSGKADVAHNAL